MKVPSLCPRMASGRLQGRRWRFTWVSFPPLRWCVGVRARNTPNRSTHAPERAHWPCHIVRLPHEYDSAICNAACKCSVYVRVWLEWPFTGAVDGDLSGCRVHAEVVRRFAREEHRASKKQSQESCEVARLAAPVRPIRSVAAVQGPRYRYRQYVGS